MPGTVIDWLLHLDTHLAALAASHGALVYLARLRLIKPEYLARTQRFFARHGRKTIILARFVPVVRTFAPFVAALGSMPYTAFLAYNVIGGLAWVGALLGAGYAFGNLRWVGAHLTVVLLGIVVLSLLPGLIGWIRERPGKASGPLA